jgi:hypothetical protein
MYKHAFIPKSPKRSPIKYHNRTYSKYKAKFTPFGERIHYMYYFLKTEYFRHQNQIIKSGNIYSRCISILIKKFHSIEKSDKKYFHRVEGRRKISIDFSSFSKRFIL